MEEAGVDGWIKINTWLDLTKMPPFCNVNHLTSPDFALSYMPKSHKRWHTKSFKCVKGHAKCSCKCCSIYTPSHGFTFQKPNMLVHKISTCRLYKRTKSLDPPQKVHSNYTRLKAEKNKKNKNFHHRHNKVQIPYIQYWSVTPLLNVSQEIPCMLSWVL